MHGGCAAQVFRKVCEKFGCRCSAVLCSQCMINPRLHQSLMAYSKFTTCYICLSARNGPAPAQARHHSSRTLPLRFAVLALVLCDGRRCGCVCGGQVAGLSSRRFTINPYLSVILGIGASVLLCAVLWLVRRYLCRIRPGAPVVRPTHPATSFHALSSGCSLLCECLVWNGPVAVQASHSLPLL